MTQIRYILDTDIITYHQFGKEPIVARLNAANPDSVATTVVTLYEQLKGRLASVNRNQSPKSQQIALQRLQATQTYYCSLTILPFEAKAVRVYENLKHQKIRVGSQDLKIASIAISLSATLVTNNTRHFEKIPDLKIENWTIT